MLSLEIFDFDWTLFRSPCAPDGRKDWWPDLKSLYPPHVPHIPDEGWYVMPVVQAALWSANNPKSIMAVVTGRRSAFYSRITNLVERVGLKPNVTFCYDGESGSPDRVVAYKMEVVETVLKEHPQIERLVVYEDLEEQLEEFAELANAYGIEYKPWLVRARHEQNLPWGC